MFLGEKVWMGSAMPMTRCNNANNYAEASIMILYKIVFGRVKAYNIDQLFSFAIQTIKSSMMMESSVFKPATFVIHLLYSFLSL